MHLALSIVVAVTLASTPAVARQAESPPAVKNAETCLRQNVTDAVRAGTGAADAAAFLMDYLCAGPIETAARHARSTSTLAMLREMQLNAEVASEDDWLAGAVVNPATGELELKAAKGPEAQATLMAVQMMSGLFGGGQTADPRPIALRELAGRLVREARTGQ
ncbi:MAG: hypothetical protein ACOH1E_05765 [Brevundimonas sp.]